MVAREIFAGFFFKYETVNRYDPHSLGLSPNCSQRRSGFLRQIGTPFFPRHVCVCMWQTANNKPKENSVWWRGSARSTGYFIGQERFFPHAHIRRPVRCGCWWCDADGVDGRNTARFEIENKVRCVLGAVHAEKFFLLAGKTQGERDRKRESGAAGSNIYSTVRFLCYVLKR